MTSISEADYKQNYQKRLKPKTIKACSLTIRRLVLRAAKRQSTGCFIRKNHAPMWFV